MLKYGLARVAPRLGSQFGSPKFLSTSLADKMKIQVIRRDGFEYDTFDTKGNGEFEGETLDHLIRFIGHNEGCFVKGVESKDPITGKRKKVLEPLTTIVGKVGLNLVGKSVSEKLGTRKFNCTSFGLKQVVQECHPEPGSLKNFDQMKFKFVTFGGLPNAYLRDILPEHDDSLWATGISKKDVVFETKEHGRTLKDLLEFVGRREDYYKKDPITGNYIKEKGEKVLLSAEEINEEVDLHFEVRMKERIGKYINNGYKVDLEEFFGKWDQCVVRVESGPASAKAPTPLDQAATKAAHDLYEPPPALVRSVVIPVDLFKNV